MSGMMSGFRNFQEIIYFSSSGRCLSHNILPFRLACRSQNLTPDSCRVGLDNKHLMMYIKSLIIKKIINDEKGCKNEYFSQQQRA